MIGDQLHIVVCVKQTASSTNSQFDPAKGTVQVSGDQAAMNPFDEYALEEGVRIKERLDGKAVVSALTLGSKKAEDTLRDAISRGATDGYLVTDPALAGSDTLATASILVKAIAKISALKGPVDLVLFGKQTNDSDTGQVGPQVAALWGVPNVAFVKKIPEIGGGRVVVHRMMEDGTDVLEMDLPAVIAVVKEINEPRVASLKGKMNAKKAVIPKWNEVDIEADKSKIGLGGSPTIVAKSFNPPPRKGGVRIDGATAQEKAKKLVDKLQEMKLI